MGFFSPWFLGGLIAVGLPIYLHLLKRHKTDPQPFPSLMFFEHREQSSVQHRRLDYILLFILRTLMLILLAHEMGHYLYCKKYGVSATLPFFIPFPTLIGTLGAFIRIRSPLRSRSAERMTLSIRHIWEVRFGCPSGTLACSPPTRADSVLANPGGSSAGRLAPGEIAPPL